MWKITNYPLFLLSLGLGIKIYRNINEILGFISIHPYTGNGSGWNIIILLIGWAVIITIGFFGAWLVKED